MNSQKLAHFLINEHTNQNRLSIACGIPNDKLTMVKQGKRTFSRRDFLLLMKHRLINRRQLVETVLADKFKGSYMEVAGALLTCSLYASFVAYSAANYILCQINKSGRFYQISAA